MKVKFHRWFQWIAVPFVALAFHIYFGYKVIGRENIRRAAASSARTMCSCPTRRLRRSRSVTARRCG